WVMLVGLAITSPFVIASGIPANLDGAAVGRLVVAGGGNVLGLLLEYRAFRLGKVGVVSSIASTEGAIAALIAVAVGESISPGAAAVAIPLAVTARLRITRRAAPLVAVAGLCEVLGFASFAIGARHGIAVTAVLGAQFAALSALTARVLFHERLTRLQLVGVVVIVAGVAILAALIAWRTPPARWRGRASLSGCLAPRAPAPPSWPPAPRAIGSRRGGR